MKIYFASDHTGYELKGVLMAHVRDLPTPEWLQRQGGQRYEVEDCGAHTYDQTDDYPDFIERASRKVSRAPAQSCAVVFGASGQGEAMVANRFPGVRAAVYYGPASRTQTDASGDVIDLLRSTRVHNDANVLSLGVRFIDEEEAKRAVSTWLSTPFSGDERHRRRIHKIDGIDNKNAPTP